jgi:hypothetical protein
MRFASIGGSNAANYAGAGKAVADSAARMHKKQRETGPDYAGLSKVAMQTASNEKIAGMQAEAKLTNVAQSVYADQTQNAYKIKVFETKEGIKASQRKAGGLAAIGKIAGAGFLASRDNTKGREYPSNSDARKALLEANKSTKDEINSRRESATAGLIPQSSPTSGGSKSGKVTSADGSLVSSAQALDAGKGSAGSGGKYNMQQMTDFAIQGGFSPENARMIAAIGMGESGGNAGIDTVQSGLDPNKSNEYSVGLSQINVQAHGDKLSRRGWTEADLRDPVKNMTIAKEVYDEAGSFNPWSVYQKGLHRQFLN